MGALLYWRLDETGHLLVGNTGAVPSGVTKNWPERLLKWLYPQVGSQAIEYRWSGRLVMTHDLLPHLHEPIPGLLVGVGYNGRGIPMGTMMGKLMAQRLSGAADELPVPLTSVPWPAFQKLRIKGLEMLIIDSQIRDFF